MIRLSPSHTRNILARTRALIDRLIGISTRLIRRDINYHTSRDTVDRIEPAAVEAGLNIAFNFIVGTDRAEARPGPERLI